MRTYTEMAKWCDHNALGVLRAAFEEMAVAHRRAALLEAACSEFVRKVEAGEARSRKIYAEMKAALAFGAEHVEAA